MSHPDQILIASDRFAVFGLERRFDLDPVLLERRHADLAGEGVSLAKTDREKGARVVEKLEADRLMLENPVTRGAHLLDLLGGAADGNTDDLPPGFAETRGDAGARDRLLAEATRLFHMLGNADNGVVQRQRRRQIRQTLNAIRLLDSSDR